MPMNRVLLGLVLLASGCAAEKVTLLGESQSIIGSWRLVSASGETVPSRYAQNPCSPPLFPPPGFGHFVDSVRYVITGDSILFSGYTSCHEAIDPRPWVYVGDCVYGSAGYCLYISATPAAASYTRRGSALFVTFRGSYLLPHGDTLMVSLSADTLTLTSLQNGDVILVR